MPWETAAFANPFQPKFKKPRFEVPQIGFREAISAPSASPAAGNMEQSSSLTFARQRLRMSGLIKTEDQLRWEALRKIKVVVLLNPMASSIGETMATQAMTLRDESKFVASFTNCFAGKATGTLVKRSYSLWRFSQWSRQRSVGPSAIFRECSLFIRVFPPEECSANIWCGFPSDVEVHALCTGFEKIPFGSRYLQSNEGVGRCHAC